MLNWRSTQSRLAALLSSLIAHRWVVPQTLWRFRLKDISLDKRVRAWCYVCSWAHQGLTVGFLLLRHSVVYTVESLSLVYLLFISPFVLTRRKPIREGSFMRTKQLFVLIHIRNKGEVGTIKLVSALQWKYFLLTVPRLCFFCGSILLFMFAVCHAFLSVLCSLVVACWERTGLLAILCDVFLCFVTFSCRVLGQVWYLLVSISNLCLLSYF